MPLKDREFKVPFAKHNGSGEIIVKPFDSLKSSITTLIGIITLCGLVYGAVAQVSSVIQTVDRVDSLELKSLCQEVVVDTMKGVRHDTDTAQMRLLKAIARAVIPVEKADTLIEDAEEELRRDIAQREAEEEERIQRLKEEFERR